VCWSALRAGTAAYVDDYTAHPDAVPGLVRAGLRAAAFAPIGPDAVLVLLRLGRARPWTSRDRTLVDAAARSVRLSRAHERTVRALQEAALTDALTGLGNRRALDADLDAALALARAEERPLLVVVIDVDGLKRVNDTRGHREGDLLLRAVAVELGERFRSGTPLFRFGGDEFAMLVPGAGAEAWRSVRTRLREVAEALGARWPGAGLSAGHAVFPADGDATAALIERADARMYDTKLARRSPAPRPTRAEG
jgi:diguanylate cyclase (GGDEF)-like protein